MFSSLVTLPVRFSPQSMPENSFPSIETSRSCRPMSYTSRNPTKIKAQASAETASRIQVRKSANLYDVLGVKETASLIEIKTAYRSLAKRFHPDAATSESDSHNFIAIHDAYSTLSDPTAKARYDLSVGAGRRSRYATGSSFDFVRQTRRWETDQCW